MPRWTLRALTFASSLRSSNNSQVCNGKPPTLTEASYVDADLSRPELQDGLATPPDLEGDQEILSHSSWKCGCQQKDYCPYCEYDQAIPVATSNSTDALAAVEYAVPVHDGLSNRTPRKLRKAKSTYQRLHYDASETADRMAAKPDSVISDNSRTPLMNTNMQPKLEYSPSPVDRRTPNKLEKKSKRLRSKSFSDTYSTSISEKVPRRPIVASKSFLRPKVREYLGPRPKPMSRSIETTALVSLAWTGETTSSFRTSNADIPSLSSPSLHSQSIITIQPQSDSPTKLSPTTDNPQVASKQVFQKPIQTEGGFVASNRPWTLAMAITDDGITDEKLVNELEDMRIKEDALKSHDLGIELHPLFRAQLYDSYTEFPLQAGETEDTFPVDSSWTAARQVLLLCRELVRTERRYLASLKTLITNGTTTPPPPSMLPYLPGLIMASESLLERMEANPSAQGVSEAFLACQDLIAASFVSWCGVVGQFFDPGEKVNSRAEIESLSNARSMTNTKAQHRSQIARTDSDLSIVIPEPNKIRKTSKLRPTVRDLAILPTQRIVRYVLLFKELYSLTPPTLSSFRIIEKALQAAEIMAALANAAQAHVAFGQRSTSTSS